MKRFLALLLTVMLFSLPFTGCAEQAGYLKEENTGRDKDSYPYIIRMPSAVWYLAKADIEMLGGEIAVYKYKQRRKNESRVRKQMAEAFGNPSPSGAAMIPIPRH